MGGAAEMVRDQLTAEGYHSIYDKAGASIKPPGCSSNKVGSDTH